MSLQFDWPKNGWPAEFVESVRSKIEGSIRKAMGGGGGGGNDGDDAKKKKKCDKNDTDEAASSPSSSSPSSSPTSSSSPSRNTSNSGGGGARKNNDQLSTLIRGMVTIDYLSLGTAAPRLTLRKITELGPARCGLNVHFAYKGDAVMSLRGIEINLDPTRVFVGAAGLHSTLAGTGKGAEVVAPFFCPLTLKLKELDLAGEVHIEIRHEVAAAASSSEQQQQQHDTDDDSDDDSDDDDANNTDTSRNTRHQLPDTFTEFFAKFAKLGSSSSSQQGGSSRSTTPLSAPQQPQQHQQGTTSKKKEHKKKQKKKIPYRRELFIQLLGEEDTLKDFSVESNFVPVPQAVEKIKNTIRAAIKPLFVRFREEGFCVPL